MTRDEAVARASRLGIMIPPYTRVAKIEEMILTEEARLLARAARPRRKRHDPGGGYAHRR